MLDPRVRLSGLSLTLGILIALSGCGGGTSQDEGRSAGLADCTKSPNGCNSGATKKGGAFTYVIEKDIELWNINDTNANVFETAEVMQTMLPGVFNDTPDLKPTLNTDLVVSATKTSDKPQTIVYKIQPNAVWSDGTPINVDDFLYAWKTLNGRDCPLPPSSDESGTKGCNPNNTAGYDRIKSLAGTDGGKTVTVVFSRPYADWQNLFGAGYGLLPAHIAKQYGGDLDSAAGLTKAWQTFNKTVPKFSGGPYLLQNWQKGSAATLVPNPKWYGKTKPALDKLIFRVISDAAQEPTALQNNEVQGIYPQPQVDLVSQAKKIPNVTYVVGHGLTWEHFDFNLKTPALRDKTLRQAMFTAVDTKALIAKTVGQFTTGVAPLGSHNYVPGQAGYKDLVSATGQGSGNVAKARQMLTQAGYAGVGSALKDPEGKTVGPFKIRYTTGNAIRKTQCELFQAQMKQLGINVNIQEIAADKLGQVLAGGQYDVIDFAWVAPPFPTNSAAQNWTSPGGGNYGKYSNKQVDKLVDQAGAASNPAQAAELLNQSDSLMIQDAYVLPLYQKPTFLAIQTRFVNVRNNSTNTGPPYNTEEWGLRGAA